MKKILFVILIVVSVISISCGKKQTATSSTATGNALPQPSVDCGGSDCL